MKTGFSRAWGVAGVALGIAMLAAAQSPEAANLQQPAIPSSAAPPLLRISTHGGLTQQEVLRVIDDPHSGARWLLVRNELAPGGPGRLVLSDAPGWQTAGKQKHPASRVANGSGGPVIRSGDRLIVEEHTAIVDASLEAQALAPAEAGAVLNVRLTIGGRVLRAVAIGPGRARLLAEEEKRP
ncbi:MAG: hypothetical protein ABSG00_04535 [Terracidiphilus sp.]